MVNATRNLDAIILASVYCAGMLCSWEERRLALLLTAALVCYAAFRLLFGRVSFCVVHIPLAALPCLYLLSSVAVGGLTFYAAGQTVLMCVPLLACLCVADTRRILPVIVAGACFLAVGSLLGALVPYIPNTFVPAGYNSDPRPRLLTLLGYANTGGMLLGLGILALIGMRSSDRKGSGDRGQGSELGRVCFLTAPKALKCAAIAVLAVCMFLTGSRLAIAQMAVLLFAYFLLWRRAKKTAIASAAALTLAVIFSLALKPELLLGETMALRLVYWLDASKAIAATPVFGLGPEGFIFKIHELQSAIYVIKQLHNAFLQAAVDAGIPALLSLAAVFALALIHSWKESKKTSFERDGRTRFFVLLLLLLHSVVDFNFAFFPALMVLGMCCAYGAPSSERTEPSKRFRHNGSNGPTKCARLIKPVVICAAALPILFFSVYIAIGESHYAAGDKAAASGSFDVAEAAYLSAQMAMPGDFRSTYRLARLYVNHSEPQKALEVLAASDPARFNDAVRSELRVIAYRDAGMIAEWGDETLFQLACAPRRQRSYSDRLEFLDAAQLSKLISNREYIEEQFSLRASLVSANNSMNYFAPFIPEKDRVLVLH